MSPSDDILIIYGSQTGQAESIAQQICDRINVELNINPSPNIYSMDQIEKQFWIENKQILLIIICSSTGDGDTPDNATKFFRYLFNKSLSTNDRLNNVTFALLGDSNFTTFQGVPRKLEKQLFTLGAHQFISTGAADDQVGLDIVVEPWIESLLCALATYYHLTRAIPSTISIEENMSSSTKMSNDDDIHQLVSTFDSQSSLHNDENREVVLTVISPKQNDNNTSASLIRGSEKLRKEQALRVPVPATSYLVTSDVDTIPWQNGHRMVGTASDIYQVPIVGTIQLTGTAAKKEKREIQIDISNTGIEYQPGDAFYFIFPNPRSEVNYILDRLQLLSLANNRLTVSINPTTVKSNAILPGHIPSVCTFRYLFTYCVDIRRSPGRPLLRALVDCTKDDGERRRLLELCSAQGVDEFTRFVRQSAISLVDILGTFSSCIPSVEILIGIEHLPRLIPRPFSVACAQSRWHNRVRFVYSLFDFTADEGRCYKRRGLCTDWLSHLQIGDKVPIMLKEPSRFRLAITNEIMHIPMLMIGPGAGLAPFLGFMQEILNQSMKNKDLQLSTSIDRWLLFGCRSIDHEYIYRDEVETYVHLGIINRLVVCESSSTKHKYVQDWLQSNGQLVYDFMFNNNNSHIYVCGDAKGMSKDVWQTFSTIIQQYSGKSDMEAKQLLMQLKENNRYMEDVWT